MICSIRSEVGTIIAVTGTTASPKAGTSKPRSVVQALPSCWSLTEVEQHALDVEGEAGVAQAHVQAQALLEQARLIERQPARLTSGG